MSLAGYWPDVSQSIRVQGKATPDIFFCSHSATVYEVVGAAPPEQFDHCVKVSMPWSGLAGAGHVLLCTGGIKIGNAYFLQGKGL